MDSLADGQSPPSLQPFWLAAIALVMVDGFILNQGLLSLFLGLWALFSLLVMVFRQHDHPQYARKRSLLLLAAAVVVVVCNLANNRLALSRAEEVIQGVALYQAKNGHFPPTLQGLTPEFLSKVPKAKVILFFNSFDYTLRGQEAYLSYKNFPPLGTSTYLFSEKRWVP